MIRIVDCLTLDHDLSLVLLAAMICLLGCFACMLVSGRALSGGNSHIWLPLISLCAGCTAWSTHFIAMLAYKTSVPITYDPTKTVLSLLVGIVIITVGLVLAFRRRDQRSIRLISGAIVGAGVAALHYIGMSSLIFPGTMTHDADLVILSLVAALGFGALSIDYLFDASRDKFNIAAGTLMLLLIVSLHFLGMSGINLQLGFFEGHVGASRNFLITGVALSTLTVLAIGIIAAVFDKRLSSQLTAQAERFKMLADGAVEGLIVHQNLDIVDTNRAGRELLGLDQNSSGRSLSEWSVGKVSDMQIGEEVIVQEIQINNHDGVDFPAEIHRRAIMLHNGELGEMISILDLTRRKQNEARIAHIGLHDPLTDLPNRRFFNELANNAIIRAKRTNGSFALLAMDLDNFKSVNDMHGHALGDELIQFVATQIELLLTDNDVVARQGGDEFTLLSAGTDQPVCAGQLAEKIHEIFSSSIVLNSAQLMVNASIGIAIYPSDGETLEELMRNADTAMYESKAQGKGTTRVFDQRMNTQLDARRALETRLRLALELDALSLNYQPLVGCNNRSTECFEALLRWTDAELGSVSPVDFIPVAEQTGLILPIGEFVLRQACKDAATWPDSIRVAVNLSVVQFSQQDIVQIVIDALHESGLSADRLELEITESLLIDDKKDVHETLDKLKALGIRIAMDDFGTGYSSLSYLQSFNLNKIKIDRAFVSELESNPENASIVQAVISMGKSLHMSVVAEGVETKEQADILSSLDCDQLQGYLISKPMPASGVHEFLRKSAQKQVSDKDEGLDSLAA